MSNPNLSVTWLGEADLKKGKYVAVEGTDGRANKWVTSYDEQYARLDAYFEEIMSLLQGDLYDQLSADFGLDESKLELGDNRLTRIVPDLKNEMRKFLFSDTVEASALLLFGTAMLNAKVESSHQLAISTDEWAELAFTERNVTPDGELAEGYYEQCTGESDENLQRKSIGRVALAIVEADIFVETQEVAFRGNLATIQTMR